MESANTLRQAIYDYAAEHYNIQPEYLWHSYPDYAILRHPDNRK